MKEAMNHRPSTTWDQPQFNLIPDPRPRQYANVSNQLTFDTARGLRQVCVVIPTRLFTIMKEILQVPVGELVDLYIQQDGEFYVFGVMWGTDGVTDLWCYTDSSLPEMFKKYV